MSIRSVHSRRTVPTQRSANELALGAWGGVLITSIPSASKAAVNFVSRSRSRNRKLVTRWSRSISRFRACCATQAPVGCAVTPTTCTLPCGDLHEEQHVDPLEEHRIDGEEVAGQHRVRLGRSETASRSVRSAARRVDAGLWRIFHTVLAATR
jgi:hypothetical protein